MCALIAGSPGLPKQAYFDLFFYSLTLWLCFLYNVSKHGCTPTSIFSYRKAFQAASNYLAKVTSILFPIEGQDIQWLKHRLSNFSFFTKSVARPPIGRKSEKFSIVHGDQCPDSSISHTVELSKTIKKVEEITFGPQIVRSSSRCWVLTQVAR